MDSGDKAMCRDRYRRLIARNAAVTRNANGGRRNRNRHALEVPESDDDDVRMVVGQAARRKLARKQRRRAVLRQLQEKAASGQIGRGTGDGSRADDFDVDGDNDDEIQGAINFGRQGVEEPEVMVIASGSGNCSGGDAGGYRELRADELAGNDPFFVA
jgi:hypothetical protein